MSEGNDPLQGLEDELKELKRLGEELSTRAGRALERLAKVRKAPPPAGVSSSPPAGGPPPQGNAPPNPDDESSEEELVVVNIWDTLARLQQPFSTQQACEAINWSERSAYRFLKQAVAEQSVEKVGYGWYRVIPPTPPKPPSPSENTRSPRRAEGRQQRKAVSSRPAKRSRPR